MAQTIGAINPIRYRGYYYDNESQFYYLINRYYDPEICRFINADDFMLSRESNNLFQYANNNPIRFVDYDGLFAWDPVIPPINSATDYQNF